MSLGYKQEKTLGNLGDTVKLCTPLYDDLGEPLTADDLISVSFTVQDPNLSQTTYPGTINDDGTGSFIYGPTTLEGSHKVMASFTLADGEVKSVPVDFEVINPFQSTVPGTLDVLAELVWHRLEDCFDAEVEGPWLRDVTKNYFSREKMTLWVNDALFEINMQNPPTSLDVTTFVNAATTPPSMTADGPLLVQATFLTVLRQLIRAYVEQPLPQGAQIVYQDRRDYMERWANVYKMEEELFRRWLAFFKRSYLGLGQSRSLISSKSGRYLGAPMRSPYSVSRGMF